MTTQDAKAKVLSFVRERNPETMELKFGCKYSYNGSVDTYIGGDMSPPSQFITNEDYPEYNIIGCDMGLQELLIAITKQDENKMIGDTTIIEFLVQYDGIVWMESSYGNCNYDLSENLHNQDKKDPNFYLKLLPLLSNE